MCLFTINTTKHSDALQITGLREKREIGHMVIDVGIAHRGSRLQIESYGWTVTVLKKPVPVTNRKQNAVL
uniref:Transposase n=1 Tax=Steinernema glaseri TaxID=37863 RepID=A0A1I7Y497_9BILA